MIALSLFRKSGSRLGRRLTMVKIWLTTAESGINSAEGESDELGPDDTYPDADGVVVNGPNLSVVRRGQIKVLSTEGKPGEQQVHTLAMYPLDVIRKVMLDE
jgi:hypothetical protein